MGLKFATNLRNARQDQITAYAGGGALLRIYNGSRPANPQTALSGQTLLAQLTCNATFAPPASNGVGTWNAIASQLSAAASGVASWFRLFKADGTTAVMDGDCSTVGAGTGDLRLDDTNIVQGGTVAISSAILTEGNA